MKAPIERELYVNAPHRKAIPPVVRNTRNDSTTVRLHLLSYQTTVDSMEVAMIVKEQWSDFTVEIKRKEDNMRIKEWGREGYEM